MESEAANDPVGYRALLKTLAQCERNRATMADTLARAQYRNTELHNKCSELKTQRNEARRGVVELCNMHSDKSENSGWLNASERWRRELKLT